MCSHYQTPTRQMLESRFGLAPEPTEPTHKTDIWPGYEAPFLRRSPQADVGDEAVPPLELVTGSFGLVPAWCDDEKMSRRTYNARSETAAVKPAFRDAWKKAQHCIVPAAAIYEPDWRSGKAVPTRITRTDGEPMGIAGLWERRPAPGGGWLHSYTMLTINADTHEVFRHLHRPDPKREPEAQDKRMVVVLPRGLYDAWLDAPADASMDFMRQFPARLLDAQAEPPLTTKA